MVLYMVAQMYIATFITSKLKGLSLRLVCKSSNGRAGKLALASRSLSILFFRYLMVNFANTKIGCIARYVVSDDFVLGILADVMAVVEY